jgi:phosphohistidine swiveling domain-containing protein
MSRDYSSMTVEEIEREISSILKKQRHQDDLFRAVVLMGQMDIAKFIYHDKKHQPETRYIKTKTKSGETAAYGQALVQLLLLMKSRGMDFGDVFEYAIEHMKDDEYKARKPGNDREVRGHPVSGGRVTGKAFVASTNDMIRNAPRDSIIIMEHADHDATEQLVNVRAVVTDQGGKLCHLATIAREKGLPAIVGTGNATNIIRTGDLIMVDADRGEVTISGRQPA